MVSPLKLNAAGLSDSLAGGEQIVVAPGFLFVVNSPPQVRSRHLLARDSASE